MAKNFKYLLPLRASKGPDIPLWFIMSQNTRHPNASGAWADVANLSYINRIGREEAESIVAALNVHYELVEAVKTCLKAEQERRKKLMKGAPATTYCEARIAMLKSTLAKAEPK